MEAACPDGGAGAATGSMDFQEVLDAILKQGRVGETYNIGSGVEVDVETGQVTVEKLVMAVDCGVAINPLTAVGQVEGGMVQALGYGHCEEMVYDEQGRMLNARFGPYKIYRADEMPRIEAYLVQTMEKTGPFGAKAIAEIPKDGVVPAIRNAILNATGVAINDTPFTPERVWSALRSS